jgi:L-glyceraldehyde 3-phosphate reductase
LTNKYLKGIPEDSRTNKPTAALKVKDITEEKLEKVRKLNDLAAERGQSLVQMVIVWVLRESVTSALIGASKVEQIVENVKALDHMEFTADELRRIEEILK